MKIYLIGSLRNHRIPAVAAQIREAGFDVFDDWFAAGPEADDHWQQYEEGRGREMTEALSGFAAQHVFEFDLAHLDMSRAGVLVMPAGKSAHMELGYLMGQGKPGYVLLDTPPERWDVMYRFTRGVFYDPAKLIQQMLEDKEGGLLK